MTKHTFKGFNDGFDTAGEYNELTFIISQLINKVHTSTLVQIKSCTNNGGVSPVGYVDVHPLVNNISGDGESIPNSVVHSVPYTRIQGGQNAVIIDPQPGDIGICLFAERDISSVKANKAQSNPGSARKYHISDGLYIGGVLNGTPNQYVQFTSSGITVDSPSEITLNAPTISLSGNVQSTGTFTNNGTNISSTHVHPDPQGGTTGTPQ